MGEYNDAVGELERACYARGLSALDEDEGNRTRVLFARAALDAVVMRIGIDLQEQTRRRCIELVRGAAIDREDDSPIARAVAALEALR